MKTKMITILGAISVLFFLSGCSSKQVKTGFLSDYSRLRTESSSLLRFVNKNALSNYSTFIVDTIELHFHEEAKAVEHRSEGKLTQQKMTDMTNYLHNMAVKAVEDSENEIAYQSSPGVARIRIAITDIDRSTAASLIPQAKIFGGGVGGASMEAEIVDSMTGEQIAAVVQSKKGSKVPLKNLGEWDAAKQVLDEWIENMQELLAAN